MAWFDIKAKGDEEAEIFIYDEIGKDPWGDAGVAAKDFTRELAKVKASRINLRINSPGGSVFDGTAIYNALKRHPATVTTYVDGLAASIASVIALAGDRVIMAKNALLMAHKAWGMSIGNADEMREMADTLEKIDGTIVQVYAEKSGRDATEVLGMMDAETWFTADEALEWGLIDSIGDELKVAAHFDLSKFRNAPTTWTAITEAEDSGFDTARGPNDPPADDASSADEEPSEVQEEAEASDAEVETDEAPGAEAAQSHYYPRII